MPFVKCARHILHYYPTRWCRSLSLLQTEPSTTGTTMVTSCHAKKEEEEEKKAFHPRKCAFVLDWKCVGDALFSFAQTVQNLKPDSSASLTCCRLWTAHQMVVASSSANCLEAATVSHSEITQPAFCSMHAHDLSKLLHLMIVHKGQLATGSWLWSVLVLAHGYFSDGDINISS